MSTKKVMSVTVAALLGLPSQNLLAQPNVSALEEVVVTARKREETIQAVPVAITAFTAESMERRGVMDFGMLSLNNPGVRIGNGTSAPGVSRIVAIRGNIQNDVTTQLDAAVGTYVDGIVVARTFVMDGALVDVESVQTLKGPQGTLFGRNTTGGAILIKTRDPELGGGVTGYLKGTAGSLETRTATLALNIPISDAVALRIVANHDSHDPIMTLGGNGKAYVAQTYGVDPGFDIPRGLGELDAEYYRAKLLWQITDATSLLLSAESGEVSSSQTQNVPTQPNDPQYKNADIPGFGGPFTGIITDEAIEADSKFYIATLTHELENGEIKFISGFRRLNIRSNQSVPPATGYTAQNKPGLEQTSYELQYNGALFDDRLEISSGLYYFDEETLEDQLTVIPTLFGTMGGRSTFMDTDIKSMSAYMQSTYALTDSANVTLGLRYTDDDRKGWGYQNFLQVQPIAPLTLDYNGSKVNYLLSFDYQFTLDVMGYVSTSTGYRSAAAGLTPSTTMPGQWGSLRPEEVTNYEIGVKSEWMNGALRLNGAVYRQDYENYQYTGIVVDSAGVAVRSALIADAVIEGGELEATVNLPWGVTLSAAWGLTKTKNKADGMELANIPENTYSVNVLKVFELGEGTLDVSINYDRQDEFFTAATNPDSSTIEARELINMSATYNRDNWSLGAFVNNVTDEEYYSMGAIVPSAGASFVSLGMPRVAGVRGTYNF